MDTRCVGDRNQAIPELASRGSSKARFLIEFLEYAHAFSLAIGFVNLGSTQLSLIAEHDASHLEQSHVLKLANAFPGDAEDSPNFL